MGALTLVEAEFLGAISWDGSPDDSRGHVLVANILSHKLCAHIGYLAIGFTQAKSIVLLLEVGQPLFGVR